MTINKYQGKTKEEAVEKAKQELGAGAVVLNVKEIKPKGMFKMFKNTLYEVTAAVEEKEAFPAQTLRSETKPVHDTISLAADEKITIPGVARENTRPAVAPAPAEQEVVPMKEAKRESTNEGLEKRLENLSNILEKQFSVEEMRKSHPVEPQEKENRTEGFQFIKMLYRTLLENDVNEKYVNQIMDEPQTIELTGKKPKVIFFIGPTGVGKTTTLAKIASRYKVDKEKKVAFLTADTDRIAATEQLRIYANILDAPMSIIYTPEEMNDAIARVSEYDLVFVDTAGFSHRNEAQCQDMKKLIDGLDEAYEKEVYLVLSATTKYKDLLEIADTYREIANYKLIFTKLDETITYGNILNIKLYSGAKLSYMTSGQNVPDDIEVFDTQKIVKQLLGGR